MKNLIKRVLKALEKYNMIRSGDSICVFVSGGKDSLVLLYLLSKIKRFYHKNFSIIAITLDMCFNNTFQDYSEIKKFCENLGVPYYVKRSPLWEIIFVKRKEKSPCSLCSKMRKGILINEALNLGCNKLALGHHKDDAVETLLLNLFYNGNFKCFSPITYLSRKKVTMIRPLFFCNELSVNNFAKKISIPILKNKCPADGITKRQKIKELLNMLESELHTDIKKALFNSILNSENGGLYCSHKQITSSLDVKNKNSDLGNAKNA